MRTLLLTLLLSVLASHSAQAKILNTAMYGVDSVTCGATNAPCRSIGRAIANAHTGDTVVVGPGYYGDANKDGDLADLGDEPANLEAVCDCIVYIDKRITVRSRDGANTTVIDARGLTNWTVSLYTEGASGAIFGGTGHGFTVRGADLAGVHVGPQPVRSLVLGNIADKNGGDGFRIFGARTIAMGNRAFDNAGHGFNVQGEDDYLSGNGSSGNSLDGYLAVSAVGARIRKSVASANLKVGFAVVNGDADLESVVAVGNGLEGVLFENADGEITNSTLMGNGHTVSSNCGINNQAGHEIRATNNYWGAPNGPGPDPADDQCLGDGSPLRLVPVRKTEIEVRLPAVR